jgi:ABC-2 type transport system permease protein
MAIHRRIYRPYTGKITGQRFRFLVLTRFALRTLFDSRPLLAFFVACNIPFIFFLLVIYINSSPAAMALLNLKTSPLRVDNFFFLRYLIFQGTLGFLLTSWVGPGLVAPDLSNDAMALYLSRPLTRTEYVLGKFSVIFLLISSITWVPGTILLALQTSLANGDWFKQYYWLFGSMFLGSIVWIAVIGLLSLALSAWVKWRIVSTSAMLGVFFVLAGFGEAVNNVLRTQFGKVFNLGYLISRVWFDLFRMDMTSPMRNPVRELSAANSWLALSAVVALCIFLLDRRLRAREVVR